MSIAKSYASALYESAKEQKVQPDFFIQAENEMEKMISLIEESRDVKMMLLSPVSTMEDKLALVQRFSSHLKISPIVTQFFVLLIKKKRLSLLKEIKNCFGVVRLTAEGGVPGKLVVAEPMNESDINILTKAFNQKLGKKVAFQVSIDPSLLAGMKVTVNGVTYDGTLRSQLQKLREGFVTGLSGAA